MLNEDAGWILAIFSVLYYLLFILLYVRLKPVISEELVNFATEYGQVQKRLLKDLALPHALLDDEGKIIWGNTAFEEMIQKQMDYKKSVTSVFPSITRDKLPADAETPECELDVQVENRDYHVKIHRISMRGAGDEAKAFDTVGYMYAMYFFDETALHLALRETI